MWQAYPFLNHRDTHPKPRIGISACLCGDPVRYDGRSKWQPALIHILETYLTLEKLCPEVAVGMGIPRPPIQLNKNNEGIEAIGVADPSQNFTQPLNLFANSIIDQQQPATQSSRLYGYLFKSRSPSCGVGSTPIHLHGIEIGHSNGIVAHRLIQRLPWLPIVEETDLDTPIGIQRFIFLVLLTCDFLQHKGETLQFHTHHARLLQALPLSQQTRIHELANQSDATLAYLSALNSALLGLSTDTFAQLFSPEAQP